MPPAPTLRSAQALSSDIARACREINALTDKIKNVDYEINGLTDQLSHAVSSLCSTPPPKKSRRMDGSMTMFCSLTRAAPIETSAVTCRH
jgi:hypothetical protein